MDASPGRRALLVLAVSAALAAPAALASGDHRPFPVTEERESCAEYDLLRRPFFGDTHVHTTHSQDASTQGTRLTPRDAYRFARGESVGIQPFDADGNALRQVALRRPLDFAVVTDHAEQIGEVHVCKTPGLRGHDSIVCWLYRNYPRASFYLMNARYSLFASRWGFCGESFENCLGPARTIWADHQAAAETAYDRTASCDFTTFIGYEWTAGPSAGAHLHRNVIFRNESVPELPISVMETGPEAIKLWRSLEVQCRNGRPGCEAITIPHNSNISAGTAFTSAVQLNAEITADEAPLRARYERLVEVMQHKGDSECALTPGVTDEACAFEKVADANPVNFGRSSAPQAVDYVRDALKRGLALGQRLGTNPLEFGLIGSTDTHLGTPGLTDERNHVGHGGAGKYARDALPVGLVDNLQFNPGGLAVLWAEENARDALFEAMLRREAYGTSGNRPVLRFFGGWDYPDDLCGQSDLVAKAYAGGVPMGGRLPASVGTAPAFVVAGLRDPDPEAGALQQIQIVKGWTQGDVLHEKVVVAAGGPNDASVDLSTCERTGPGQDQLCGVWRDPDFDAEHPAFYYARVLENPSCRWSQWACNDAGVDCSDPGTIGEGLQPCCSEEHQRTIQERAWSSPIWYTPPP